MAQQFMVVSSGAFLTALQEAYLAANENNTNDLFINHSSFIGTPRQRLNKTESTEAIAATKMTVLEIFAAAGIPIEISDEDKMILSALESLNEDNQNRVLTAIRTICDPWWVEVLDTDRDTSCNMIRRFHAYVQHKYPPCAEVRFISDNYLQTIFPAKRITHIPTDSYPQLCKMTGVPISFVMDLPMSDVSFYTHNRKADRVFTEYLLVYSAEIKSVIAGMINRLANAQDN